MNRKDLRITKTRHELLNCSGLITDHKVAVFSTADWAISGQDYKCSILIGCYLTTLWSVSNPEKLSNP